MRFWVLESMIGIVAAGIEYINSSSIKVMNPFPGVTGVWRLLSGQLKMFAITPFYLFRLLTITKGSGV